VDPPDSELAHNPGLTSQGIPNTDVSEWLKDESLVQSRPVKLNLEIAGGNSTLIPLVRSCEHGSLE